MSDVDTAVVDSLKVLDPERPIREADKPSRAKIDCCRLSTKQESNREIPVSKNAFEIAEEIRAIQSYQGIRDFSWNKPQKFEFQSLAFMPEPHLGSGLLPKA